MSQSSAKRRKLDDSLSQAVDSPLESNGQPTTPTRASYLSPTKSSLARSHPHLVTRSTRRSTTEPRGKALRDEILGERSQIYKAPKTAPRTRQSLGLDGTSDVNFGGTSSNPGQTEEVVFTNATDSAGHQRSPLKERQPEQHKSRGESVSSDEPVSPIILPKLVPRKEAGPVTRDRSGEPELPPTPLQLGLSLEPERPRGLGSSSSPRGSKMSTGSRRRRTRSGAPVTSSPLKPKGVPPTQTEDEGEDEEAAPIGAQEAPESEPDHTPREDEEESTELQEQRSTLKSLREHMENLKQETRKLQEAMDHDSHCEEILAMLQQSAEKDASLESSDVTNGYSILAHLNLFVPGALRLTSRTQTALVDDRTKIVHTLRVEAPLPWLPNALSCVFEVTVDAENVQIEHVELKEAMMAVTRRTKSATADIHTWVQSRCQSPLHQFDVSGMVWGMGRWFSAAIERAKIYHWVDQTYNRVTFKQSDQSNDSENYLTRDRCIELARYLDTSQHTAVDTDITAVGNKKFRKKLMLNWEIKLDWAGGITSDIQISTFGMPQKAEPELKTVFCDLVPKVGVKVAFANIWKLIHSESEGFKMGGSKEKVKTKRKR